MKLRLAVIGLGSEWQSRYRPALQLLQQRFDVRSVYTPASKRSRRFASELGADCAMGFRSAIQRSDVDAVAFLESTWHGWLPVLAACHSGKAIFWGGRHLLDSSDDQMMRQQIDESGVAFVAAFPRRFASATLRMKELIATRLGQPHLILCHHQISDAGQTPPGSMGLAAGVPDALACPDAAVRQELIELIDWCRYIVGRPIGHARSMTHHFEGVTESREDASTGRSYSIDRAPMDSARFANTTGRRRHMANALPAHQYRCLHLSFGAGENASAQPPVMAEIRCGDFLRPQWNTSVGFRSPAAMQICCENGMAFLDPPGGLVWFDAAGQHIESLESEMSVGEQMLTHFHRSVTSLVRRHNDLDDLFAAARLLETA
ncbi:MAG: gfo/Idh/MocA family oxidoreductase [Planctomycetota bacterium]